MRQICTVQRGQGNKHHAKNESRKEEGRFTNFYGHFFRFFTDHFGRLLNSFGTAHIYTERYNN
jgi:hypothetical protein